LFIFGARARTLSNERVVVDFAPLGVNHHTTRLGDVSNRTPRLGTRHRLGGTLAMLNLRDVLAIREIDNTYIVSKHTYYLSFLYTYIIPQFARVVKSFFVNKL
jgi:hypothetical protein